MKYEYTLRQSPEVIVGTDNIVLATTEYGVVQYTVDKLIVQTAKNVRYEYSYEQNSWTKIVNYVATFSVKPPVLKCDNLDVDNALFFSMIVPTDPANYYRKRREEVCYPIINRGLLWYNRLTLAEKAELNDWYEAWLDATETLVIPQTPEWINNKLDKIEQEELL